MLTVDDFAKVRLAHRDGMSIRAIARTFKLVFNSWFSQVSFPQRLGKTRGRRGTMFCSRTAARRSVRLLHRRRHCDAGRLKGSTRRPR